MGLKFTLTCRRCQCAMDFDTGHCVMPDRIICQNCGQELSDGKRGELLAAISAINTLLFEPVIVEREGFRVSAEIIPSPYADDPEMG